MIIKKKEKSNGKQRIFAKRGGASPLSRQDKGSGGIVWKKLLRYYGTKALRSNSRVIKSNLQYVILKCLRHDNTLDIGETCHVILNLFQDLVTVAKRKAPLPTLSSRGRVVVEPRQHIEFSCHCEGERSEAVAIAKSLDNNEITTSCAAHTPRNDMKIICHPEAIAEGSQKVNEMLMTNM